MSNSKGDKKSPGKALYCNIIKCGDICDFDLYLGHLLGKRFPEFLTLKGKTPLKL